MQRKHTLQVRINDEERVLIEQAAYDEHLSCSTWARWIILKAINDDKTKPE